MSGEAELVEVSPDVACRWLATSRQASLRDNQVAAYATAITDGAWDPERHRRDPIDMRRGRLGEGNHRLAAIRLSGVTAPMWVLPPASPLDYTRPEELAPMKIKMLTSMSGPGGAVSPGEVIEKDADTARRLIDAKLAEPVRQPRGKKSPVETTEQPAAETPEG